MTSDPAAILDHARLAVFLIPIVLVAFAYHEMAHAYVAMWFGDPTPGEHGRRTLNPIKHLDLVGTIMLIATMLLLGFPMGFAVTPVNESKMRRPRLGGALTSLAGPLVNILFCVAGAFGVVWAVENLGPDSYRFMGSEMPLLFEIAWYTATFNAFLAVFNLLPIPPLDGGHIVGSFMNDRLRREWRKIDQYGILIILGLVFLGGQAFSQLLFELQRYLFEFISTVTNQPAISALLSGG